LKDQWRQNISNNHFQRHSDRAQRGEWQALTFQDISLISPSQNMIFQRAWESARKVQHRIRNEELRFSN
jgi:hypothetical protein